MHDYVAARGCKDELTAYDNAVLEVPFYFPHCHLSKHNLSYFAAKVPTSVNVISKVYGCYFVCYGLSSKKTHMLINLLARCGKGLTHRKMHES